MRNNHLINIAYELQRDIKVHLPDGDTVLKAGVLFTYDPMSERFAYTIGDEIPEIKGTVLTVNFWGSFQNDNNFKTIVCPKEKVAEIEEKIKYLQKISTISVFKPELWPNYSGDIGKKYFKFGEKAIFVDNFPLSRGNTKYKIGEVYPTLGSTELKVLIVDKKGQLDLIPFFAVDKAGGFDRLFMFKWRILLALDQWKILGVLKTISRRTKTSLDMNVLKLGEVIKITADYPLSGWLANYRAGELYTTLGMYRGQHKVHGYSLQYGEEEHTISVTEPRALIVNKLGQLDLIPVNYFKRVNRYDFFFVLNYYVKLFVNKFVKKEVDK